MHGKRVSSFFGVIAAAGLLAATVLTAGLAHADDADPDTRVAKSMATLKAMTAKLGPPKLEGTENVGGIDAPALYFGTTKLSNNFEIVDAIGKQDGKGMTATLFVKGEYDYVRVTTSVPRRDGRRAIGTVLAGPALESIKAGKPHYGEVPILGMPYVTGYEPIRDASGAIMGVYYVGYRKQ
jgi:Cache 3/Cache 2 fusion domain